MSHHPALAESGELEIAQRAALVSAQETYDERRVGDDLVEHVPLSRAIDAYLAAMRRAWHPLSHPIEIGEGDYVVLDVAGARLEVHADVVRERDVQVDKSLRWPEYPRATIRGNGHFYEDDGEQRVEIDGLHVYLGD